MGKYTEVLKALEVLPVDKSRQVYIDQFKDQIKSEFKSTVDLARYYRDLRQDIEDLEEAVKELNVELEATQQLVHERYEAEELTSLKLSDGGSVSVQEEPYAQVVDPALFRTYCLTDPDLRQQVSLPWQTTNAMVKQSLLEGQDYPPGVKAYIKPKLVWRRK